MTTSTLSTAAGSGATPATLLDDLLARFDKADTHYARMVDRLRVVPTDLAHTSDLMEAAALVRQASAVRAAQAVELAKFVRKSQRAQVGEARVA